MKQAMEIYFNKLLKEWEAFNGTLPMAQWIEEAEKFIFESKKDEEGYIAWKPLKKDGNSNFEDVEKELSVQLYPDIKAYFNCYWFLELAGNYNGYDLVLNPVVPGIELKDFKQETKLYKAAHNHQLVNIHIGIESNGLLLVVDNESGEVKLEDYERKSFERISGNLSELIGNL
ncbi:SecY-interacting protein Syd [Priestia aryabhattai]|uniref:SecY-interacting protein Syd n=1 Tax=Priestia aryabhattai TaxID=412384 RepID=UPI0039A34710